MYWRCETCFFRMSIAYVWGRTKLCVVSLAAVPTLPWTYMSLLEAKTSEYTECICSATDKDSCKVTNREQNWSTLMFQIKSVLFIEQWHTEHAMSSWSCGHKRKTTIKMTHILTGQINQNKFWQTFSLFLDVLSADVTMI